MVQTSDRRRDWYLSNFEKFEKGLNGDAASHIHAIRKAAMARFAELGFPTTHDEEWKYTDVSPIASVPFKHVLGYEPEGATAKDVERFSFGNLHGARLVCVNGRFSEKLSSAGSFSAGVRMGSLAVALRNNDEVVLRHVAKYARYDDNAFTALSTAFLRDGIFIYVPKGRLIETPIHLIFLSTGLESEFVSYPRNLFVAEENSQTTIIETHASLANNTYFTNTVTEIVLGENAIVEHEKLQTESDHAFHVGMTYVQQNRNSSFTSHSISLGGALVRNNLTAVLDGEGAECTLNGLYAGMGDQHVDNHTTIDHAKPHCSSHELYKGILAGKSRGVFNGKIIVRKNAQKTDAKQTNKNLVLSNEASIDTKPQLEIFANDVRCTHGATIGQLDEEAIFYLRSRGIGLNKTRDILVYAFASDVIDRINVGPLREEFQQMLHAWLDRAHPVQADS